MLGSLRRTATEATKRPAQARLERPAQARPRRPCPACCTLHYSRNLSGIVAVVDENTSTKVSSNV